MLTNYKNSFPISTSNYYAFVNFSSYLKKINEKKLIRWRIRLLTSIGCDSIINLNLTVRPQNTFTQNISLCAGQSITVCGNTHSTSGTYTDVCTDVHGCDSTVTTNLTIVSLPVIDSVSIACIGTTSTADVTVHATTSSGTLEYSLDGSTYQSSNVFNSVANGLHTISVRIVNLGCNTPQSITVNCSTSNSYITNPFVIKRK